jgi:hypothetical protein
MKFATYEIAGREESGVLVNDQLFPLSENLLVHVKVGLSSLLAEGKAAEARGVSHPLSAVKHTLKVL